MAFLQDFLIFYKNSFRELRLNALIFIYALRHVKLDREKTIDYFWQKHPRKILLILPRTRSFHFFIDALPKIFYIAFEHSYSLVDIFHNTNIQFESFFYCNVTRAVILGNNDFWKISFENLFVHFPKNNIYLYML